MIHTLCAKEGISVLHTPAKTVPHRDYCDQTVICPARRGEGGAGGSDSCTLWLIDKRVTFSPHHSMNK